MAKVHELVNRGEVYICHIGNEDMCADICTKAYAAKSAIAWRRGCLLKGVVDKDTKQSLNGVHKPTWMGPIQRLKAKKKVDEKGAVMLAAAEPCDAYDPFHDNNK